MLFPIRKTQVQQIIQVVSESNLREVTLIQDYREVYLMSRTDSARRRGMVCCLRSASQSVIQTASQEVRLGFVKHARALFVWAWGLLGSRGCC